MTEYPTIVGRAKTFAPNKLALAIGEEQFTYGDLLSRSAAAAGVLLDGKADLNETRVAFLVPAGVDYIATQWGIWRAGGLALPLCTLHPLPELEYAVDDSGATILVAHPSMMDRLVPIAESRKLRLLSTADLAGDESVKLPVLKADRRAMMLYTSGSTGRPKGVVTTHANIDAQVRSLVEAWDWNDKDRILHTLPLHHIHGVINVLCCAMYSGAVCEMLAKFDPDVVWDRLASGELTLYMAVPTIYAKLITAYEKADAKQQQHLSDGARKLRLMVSGSAALPVSTLEHWETLTGQRLLERYGMTEIGMGLSNPLNGERRAGHVGKALPLVQARIVDEEGNEIVDAGPEVSGEIQIKGNTVFGEYWNRPDATAEAFGDDGWFKTGDIAVIDQGYFRILGRSSVDIIKTGGYKVSALEIEEVLRTHDAIRDCAVVGVPDDQWGERVSAMIVLHEGQQLVFEVLRDWVKERLAIYKAPADMRIVEDLPRNAMGKVVKPDVKSAFDTPTKAN